MKSAMEGCRPVGTLAFDWNGTLVDDAARACRATNRVLREHGLPALSDRQFRHTFTLPMRRFFCRLGVPADLAGAAEDLWNRAMAGEPAPLSPGAAGILATAAARGVRVVVVSAAATASVSSDARALDVDRYLTRITGGVRDKAAVLAGIVAADRGRVIYVGDVEHDMRSAVAAGAYPIGFGAGYRPATALAGAGAQVVVWNLAALDIFLCREGGLFATAQGR